MQKNNKSQRNSNKSQGNFGYGNKKNSQSQMKNYNYAKAKSEIQKPKLPLVYSESMSVSDIAEVTKRSVAEIIKTLISLGIMANQTQSIDRDTAELLAGELGIEFKIDESKDHQL